jgi:YVTN family beta-propeller protein
MSYGIVMNDNTEAQLSQNTLESIVNQTNVLTSAQLSVGDEPSFIVKSSDAIYVANSASDTVSVINPITNTVIKNIHVGDDPSFIAGSSDAIYVANTGSDTVSVIIQKQMQ